jgi:hypothetical protein
MSSDGLMARNLLPALRNGVKYDHAFNYLSPNFLTSGGNKSQVILLTSIFKERKHGRIIG